MYADDTNITVSGKSLKDVVNITNTELHDVSNWLSANKLSLNQSKTEQMFIGSDDKLRKITNVACIHIGNTFIDRVSSTKTVGVMVDERLSWASHTDNIYKKVSSGIAGIKQIRDFISQETAVLIYISLVRPWFDYCDVVWDNLPATLAERLQKLQNRAARVITRESYEVRSESIRQRLGWANLTQSRMQHKAITVFKILSDSGPTCLKELFRQRQSQYGLRQNQHRLQLPKPRTNFMKRTIAYDGAKLWNSLPAYIKGQKTVASFKRELSSVQP